MGLSISYVFNHGCVILVSPCQLLNDIFALLGRMSRKSKHQDVTGFCAETMKDRVILPGFVQSFSLLLKRISLFRSVQSLPYPLSGCLYVPILLQQWIKRYIKGL